MAWTSQIVNSNLNFVTVEYFENGVSKAVDTYQIQSADQLAKTVRNRIADLTVRVSAQSTLPATGQEIAAASPDVPSADEQTRADFTALTDKRAELNTIKLGLAALKQDTTEIEQQIAALDAQIIDAFNANPVLLADLVGGVL